MSATDKAYKKVHWSRRNLSLPEKLLWVRLRGSDIRFRKQHPTQGIDVLRIPARDVLTDPDAIADGLLRLCAKPLHHPPSPSAAADGPPPHAFGVGRSE